MSTKPTRYDARRAVGGKGTLFFIVMLCFESLVVLNVFIAMLLGGFQKSRYQRQLVEANMGSDGAVEAKNSVDGGLGVFGAFGTIWDGRSADDGESKSARELAAARAARSKEAQSAAEAEPLFAALEADLEACGGERRMR